MNRFITVVVLALMMFNCASDDEIVVDELDGKFFRLTRFAIETAVDINDDGIFSNDLLLELNIDHCINSNGIRFRDRQVNGIIEYIPMLEILDENTANSRYDIGCGVIDYFALIDYSVENNTVLIGGGENPFVGAIDENTISFNLSSLLFFSIKIIDEEGMIQNYDDTVDLTFTLVE